LTILYVKIRDGGREFTLRGLARVPSSGKGPCSGALISAGPRVLMERMKRQLSQAQHREPLDRQPSQVQHRGPTTSAEPQRTTSRAHSTTTPGTRPGSGPTTAHSTESHLVDRRALPAHTGAAITRRGQVSAGQGGRNEAVQAADGLGEDCPTADAAATVVASAVQTGGAARLPTTSSPSSAG
jgi:hypothetical protein